MSGLVNKVIVLGGGSAGFMAAIALKAKLPGLDVLVIRSKDIGIIGVGEGSTVTLTKFLHEYLKIGLNLATDQPDSPHLAAAKTKAELYFACAETDIYAPQEIIDKVAHAMRGANAEVVFGGDQFD